ncbi:MAG: MBL fold metallo-hydrolase [Candidatus Heimdallarchaeota archaeon]|nr:MBL fold metallo-hydrolase [Candidatus Heimdallarchaeota archaeon]MBY8994467.1 MBL fold metallo-hydrolase [Candidatus Heimdallarchaeota archaeon]
MQIIILGSGQDAGVPQISCDCQNCSRARKNPKLKLLGPSIALLDSGKKYCYLIDASPDIKHQIESIKEIIPKVKTQETIPISGIFLTHAHFGHVSGLWSFGKECIDTQEITVFCSAKMSEFLVKNHPFSHMLARKNFCISEVKINQTYPIEDFKITSIQVPHRDEYADTVGYIIEQNKKLLYLPDLDYWTEDLIKLVESVDIALIDGSFYSKDELPGRDDVPHPPIEETMKLLNPTKTEIYFTHFNHTNSILQKEGKERKETQEKGFQLAYDGLIINI